jgi:hypothetical protein
VRGAALRFRGLFSSQVNDRRKIARALFSGERARAPFFVARKSRGFFLPVITSTIGARQQFSVRPRKKNFLKKVADFFFLCVPRWRSEINPNFFGRRCHRERPVRQCTSQNVFFFNENLKGGVL